MKVTEFKIKGPLLIENRVFPDDRGFFTERFRVDRFEELGIRNTFVQDNFSISRPRVLRGLHYQFTPAQTKLVTCVSGRIFDVAVDIRNGSPTFGQWVSAVLDSREPQWLLVPTGFAHGFCVIGDEDAGVMYKVDAPWASGGESGIAWNDPNIAIEWPVTDPIVSPKDLELQSLATYSLNPKFSWNKT